MPEFSVGQRVRMTAKGEQLFTHRTRSRTGIVAPRIPNNPDLIAVKRDGIKTVSNYHKSFWEPLEMEMPS